MWYLLAKPTEQSTQKRSVGEKHFYSDYINKI